jgi:hypothetical protein
MTGGSGCQRHGAGAARRALGRLLGCAGERKEKGWAARGGRKMGCARLERVGLLSSFFFFFPISSFKLYLNLDLF